MCSMSTLPRPPATRERSRMGFLLAAACLAIVWPSLPNAETTVNRADSANRLSVPFEIITATQSYLAQRRYAGKTVPRRSAELGFKTGGEVAHILVDLGDRVRKGAPLAHLDKATLDAQQLQTAADVQLAEANVQALIAESQLARNTERRVRRLLDEGHTSRQLYDEADLALKAKLAQLGVARASLARARAANTASAVALREATLYAPFDGVIQARHQDEGSQLRPGQALLRLVEGGNTEAHIGVPARASRTLAPGQTYTLRWAGQPYTARLKSLLPEVNPESRTITAVFDLPEADMPLGSVVELAYEESVDERGFWLPVTSLTSADRGLWAVYVIGANDAIERRLVDVIHSEAERVFVRGTLSDAERIVSSGVNRVVPGQAVMPVPAMQANAR